MAARQPVNYDTGIDSFGDATILVTMAGSGGVGKSTLSLGLAQRAGDPNHGGLNVLLVDMNRGQPDIDTYLRVAGTNLPTAYDASAVADPTRAITDKTTLQQARARVDRSLPPVHFSVVLGPDRAHGNAQAVPATTYQQIISAAKPHYDLIIIDTQSLEASDDSGLIDGVAVPLMRSDGWGLMVSRSSRPSINNAHAALTELSSLHIDSERMMIALNRVGDHNRPDPRKMKNDFLGYALYVDAVDDNGQIDQNLNGGKILIPSDAQQVFDTVLYRVTGRAVFDPEQHIVQQPDRAGGFLARLFGGGAR